MDYLSFLAWILLSLTAIHLILSHVTSGQKKLPPGPFPLPIVGNLFLLGDSPHKSITELAKVHGPLMYLRLGSQRIVVISSASIAKQLVHENDAAVSYRTVPDSFTALEHHRFSIIYSPYGDLWRTFRRVSHNLIFSSSRLDSSKSLRRNKLEGLISYVKLWSQAGEAIDIGHIAFNTILNLLSNTLFSVDLADPDSCTSREFKEAFSQMLIESAKPNLADYFPVLKWIDPQRIRRHMGVHFGKVIHLFTSIINQRLAATQGCSDEDDALDALLRISHDNTQELQLSHIPHLLMELFVGGIDTTSSTIEWAMTELLRNPNKMNEARRELELVVGKGVTVKEEDFPRLPYLQAVIKETLRMHGPVPFIPRRTNSNIDICGFTIPKNTRILINLCAIGKDPSVWDKPGSFEPERFLGSEIDVKGLHFELIPFGAGRRICPGLPLVMRMIPLMLGSLVNCFDWKLEDGLEPGNMNMDAKFGLALQKAQPLRAIPTNVI